MQKNIKEIVQRHYAHSLKSEEGCCNSANCSDSNSVKPDYSNTKGHVDEADYGLGCGIPTEYAHIQHGDTVLDLGCGAGNDIFVARNLAGPSGILIGVDFTDEMIAKARENQEKLQYQNISFIKGDIEDLPVKDNIVDVAISNCTMNLVPNKSKAYQEVFRVLKKGGHFSISDIVLGKSLPEHIRKDAEIYAGCISGAQLQDEYLETIRNAGFCSVEIKTVSNIHLPEKLLEKHLSGQELNSWNKKDAIKSITVYGEK